MCIVCTLTNDSLKSILHPESLQDLININSSNNVQSSSQQDDQFLKIVKNITSKGFIRSNYEEKLVDLSDVRINLKSKS